MQDETEIVASPSLIQIAFGMIGILFPSSIATYLIHNNGAVDQNSKIAFQILTAIFILFALLSFIYLILLSKKITLTNNSLVIYYPLLFRSKEIYFDEIKKVSIKKYDIKTSTDFSTTEVYTGTKIVMELYESKNIEITSFEVSNYKNLAENLKNVTKSYFKIRVDSNNKNLNNTKITAYLWLVFISLLTFGLIISILQKNI